jgi:hypothetical protein
MRACCSPLAATRALGFVAFGFLAGCTTLLPDTRLRTEGQWNSFDEARTAIQTLQPYTTRGAALRAQGIDPYANPNVTILTYSDLLQRFAVGSTLGIGELDPGIRDCLRASKACVGYAINQRRLDRKRVGNFWLDSFNFKRDVEVTGWTFNALIIVVDDLVVYTLVGGQPYLHEHEVSRNPLGPFQSWGDSVGRGLIR